MAAEVMWTPEEEYDSLTPQVRVEKLRCHWTVALHWPSPVTVFCALSTACCLLFTAVGLSTV
jgi:hypothetical protein